MEAPWPRVYHTGRREYGTIVADMPSAPDTVFVVFDGDPDAWEVSRSALRMPDVRPCQGGYLVPLGDESR